MIESAELRQLAAHFATGVAVVTTRDAEGRSYGLTVNALASLSMDPPLYLVCVSESSDSLPVMLQSRVLAINILAEDQEYVSRIFASKAKGKFDGVSYRPGDFGAPLLDGTLTTAECRVQAVYPGDDHKIVVGRVEDYWIGDGKPLVSYRGGYAELGGIDFADQSRIRGSVGL